MNALLTPFHQLVERRLWPLAALLVGALVAVPFVLAKDPEEAAGPAGATAAAGAVQGSTQPIVSVADAAARDSVRKVLGSAKNPFRPAVKGQPADDDTSTGSLPSVTIGGGASSGGTTGGLSGGSIGGGSGAPSTPTTPVDPVPTTPTVPLPTFELHSLVIRFGESSGDVTPRVLQRLTALPGRGNPALIYLGLMRDEKTAAFLVESGSLIQGDGRCRPSPENCQRLLMKPGETTFIDVPAGDGTKQYQLDMLRVTTKRTTDAELAERVYAAESAAGKRELRRRNFAGVGPLRYDDRTGTLKRLSPRAWKKAAASAARASAAAAE